MGLDGGAGVHLPSTSGRIYCTNMAVAYLTVAGTETWISLHLYIVSLFYCMTISLAQGCREGCPWKVRFPLTSARATSTRFHAMSRTTLRPHSNLYAIDSRLFYSTAIDVITELMKCRSRIVTVWPARRSKSGVRRVRWQPTN